MTSADQLITELKNALGGTIETVHYKEGDLIIEKGSLSPIYVIVSGVCTVYIHDNRGGEIILSQLGRGNTIGDMSNFNHSKTTANVKALSDAELLKISEEDFNELISKIPSFAQILYSQLCSRLQNTNDSLTLKVNQLLQLNENLTHRVDDQIKDIKLKNEELEENNKKLDEMIQLRDKFLGIAVHDLRSPLSSIMGYLELLTMTEAINDPQVKTVSDIMFKNCTNMFELINDILDIKKIESNNLQLELQECNFDSIIHECYNTNVILTNKKGILFEVDHLPDLPPCKLDRRRVIEILNNLINNATKFSDRGSTIQIKTFHSVSSKNIVIEVIDQGQGIPKDEIPLLFQSFQQVSTKSTEGEKGTGLGLAIVKKLIDLHNGTIEVHSIVGKGTTFRLCFPIASST